MEKQYKKVVVRIEVSDIPDATEGKLVFHDATIYYGREKDLVGIESSRVDEVIKLKDVNSADSFVLEITPEIPTAFGKVSVDKETVTIAWDFGEQKVGGTFKVIDVIETI